MLGDLLELTIETIGKYVVIFKIIYEEIFQLGLHYYFFIFKIIFRLMSMLNHYFLKKCGSK